MLQKIKGEIRSVLIKKIVNHNKKDNKIEKNLLNQLYQSF